MQLVTTHARVPRPLACPRSELERLRAMSAIVGVRVDAPSVLGGAPPAFTPAALPTPILWHDWSNAGRQFLDTAGTTLAPDASPVALYRDLVTSSCDVQQAGGTARPTRNALAVPLPVTFWDGTDRMFSPGAIGPYAQPFTFCVISDNLSNLSMFYDHGVGATRVLAQRGAAATTAQINAGATLAATVTDMGTRQMYLFEYNGASSKIWLFDGTNFVQVGATGNAGTNTLADLKMGGNASSFLLANLMSEVFAWNASPTAQDRTNIASYAKPKWGL